jgi:streptogramin lyase
MVHSHWPRCFQNQPGCHSGAGGDPAARRAHLHYGIAVCLALLLLLPGAPVRAESNEVTAVDAAFGNEYAVPNGPRNLAAEAPGRIWYTAREAGGIGLLEVISSPDEPAVRYRTEFYGLGENSFPYDIVYDDGVVWFTLQGIRSLGRIDVATREIKTYALLSVGAAPTGLDVDPEGNLWLAQSNGRISRFDPVTEKFTEFVMPDEIVAGAPRMEDVAYQNTRNVWFTMPDAAQVVVFNPTSGRFFDVPTQEPGPTNIQIANGTPWVTANGSGRVGRFTVTTVSTWIWYDLPTPNSGPAGLLIFDDADGVQQIWITENTTGGAARIQIVNNFQVANREQLNLGSPPGNPWGIIRAADDHLWIADTSRNVLYEVPPPYISRNYIAWIPNVQPEEQ